MTQLQGPKDPVLPTLDEIPFWSDVGGSHLKLLTYIQCGRSMLLQNGSTDHYDLIFAILQCEITSLNWIFLPAVVCKIQV